MSAIYPTGFRQTFFFHYRLCILIFYYFCTNKIRKNHEENTIRTFVSRIPDDSLSSTDKESLPKKKKIYLSDKAAAEYEKIQKLGEQFIKQKGDNMTDADWEYLAKLVFDETRTDYWQTIGDGCSWYCGDGGPIKIKASSRLKSQGKNSYNEENLHDFSYKTPWVEGADGYGEGEWGEYTFTANSPRITEIRIANGYVKSQTAWQNNSRVKKLKVYVNNKPYAFLNLEDSRSEQTFKIAPLTDKKKQWTMKFEIVEVYKGEKYDDTALSEIYFDGLDVHCFVAGTKILMSDNSTKNIEEIKRGDKILTFNKLTNKKEVATVEETASVKHNNLVTYTFEGGKTITATDDHPFMTKRGWASMNPSKSLNYKGFEQICRIKAGDKFVTNSGMLTLVSTSVSPESHTTYTITKLSDGNSFYANDLLVGVEEMK